MQRRALPAGHPEIAVSQWNLALLYKEEMKQYNKALPMFEEVHAIWLAAHGPEYERTGWAADEIEEIRQLIGEEASSG